MGRGLGGDPLDGVVHLGDPRLVVGHAGVGGEAGHGGALLLGAALDADGQLGQAAGVEAAHDGLRGQLGLQEAAAVLDLGGVVLGDHDAGAGHAVLERVASGDGLALGGPGAGGLQGVGAVGGELGFAGGHGGDLDPG